MSRYYTETEVIAMVEELTRPRLRRYCRARIVQPVTTPDGPGFREADLARLQLLCDLADCHNLPEDGLRMVMSLIDQLNTARGDMRALMQAVAAVSRQLDVVDGGYRLLANHGRNAHQEVPHFHFHIFHAQDFLRKFDDMQ